MTKYHFVGIKGSGMSSLAQVLDDLGYQVQGSDVETTYFTQKPLEEKGIKILPFQEENIEEGMCVIASNAFQDDHVEVSECFEKGVPLYRYHQFLGEFVQGFTSIAVTGAHGKTSTTGLLAHVLKGLHPTSYLIGDGTGKGEQGSEYFVFEACEYRRHFLAYQPDYAIMTNIDFDHPDYFSDVNDVFDAFDTLSKQVNKGIVACGDDKYVRKLNASVPILYYGFHDNNHLQARPIKTDVEGETFDVFFDGAKVEQVTIPMFGRHNILNALAVIGICILEDMSLDKVRSLLYSFAGVKRRFSEKHVDSNIMIDDYAHHPTEIKATIEAVRAKYPEKKLVSIFQPHTFTRTETFLHEFAESLSAADQVYLCDIFSSARERQGSLTINDLMRRIPSSKLICENSTHQLGQYSDSILLFMGAGDIQKVQHAFEETVVV